MDSVFKDDQPVIFAEKDMTYLQFKNANSDWEWREKTFKHDAIDYDLILRDWWNLAGEQIINFYNTNQGKALRFFERPDAGNFYNEGYG